MSLHDLLDDVASTAPPADAGRSADRAWGTAARRRRRARITAGAAVLGLVVVALLVGTSIARPAPKPLPGNAELAPGQGLPARIYTVQPWLDTIGSSPIPPIAYVYSGGLDKPVAVSVDGSYRYLPTEHPKDLDVLTSYALSPDGHHLAMAWSPFLMVGATPLAMVVVYDVVAGAEVGRWTTAPGVSSKIDDLAWNGDGSALGWEETVATDFVDDGIVGGPQLTLLDLGKDDVTRRSDLQGPLAWSPDGVSIVARNQEGQPVVASLAGGGQAQIENADDSRIYSELSFAPNGWSPDGQTLVGLFCDNSGNRGVLTCTKSSELPMATAVVLTGEATYSDPFGSAILGQVLGWRDGAVMLGLFRPIELNATGEVEGSDGAYLVGPIDAASGGSVGPTVIRSEDGLEVTTLVVARDLLEDAPIIDLPPPAQSRFSWNYIRWALSEHAVTLAVLVLFPVLAIGFAVSRRPRRRPVPSR